MASDLVDQMDKLSDAEQQRLRPIVPALRGLSALQKSHTSSLSLSAGSERGSELFGPIWWSRIVGFFRCCQRMLLAKTCPYVSEIFLLCTEVAERLSQHRRGCAERRACPSCRQSSFMMCF